MGSANCRSYSRNKRGIAGGLIWINFDRHSLLALFKKARGKFLADVDEIRPQYQDSTVGAQAVFTSSLVRTVGPSIGGTIDQLDNLSVSEVGGSKELADPWYSDQILPSMSPSPVPTNTVPWRQPRSSASRSSTKAGAPRSTTPSARCRRPLLGCAGGPMQVYRPSPSFYSPLTPPPQYRSHRNWDKSSTANEKTELMLGLLMVVLILKEMLIQRIVDALLTATNALLMHYSGMQAEHSR